MEHLIRQILSAIGENPKRQGLLKTPARVARSYEFLLQGYRMDPKTILKNAIFNEECNHMIIVRDIEVYSMCEHHMLPFFGKAHVAYIPDGKIVGLSKIPRIIEVFSRRLQVQERMTQQIADTLYDALSPLGVGVVIEARHMCMMMRGVEKQNSIATTSAMLGVFREDDKTRQEFLMLINSKLP